MNILVDRTKQDDHQTTGLLSLIQIHEKDGVCREEEVFRSFCIEPPWENNHQNVSRIPPGTYPAVVHQSPKFGKSVWIQDVPGRSEILIHRGNYRRDTLGCILPGRSLIDIDGDGHKDVTSSVDTMNELLSLIEGDELTVTVKDSF